MPVSSMAMLPQSVSCACRRLGFLLTAVVLIPPLALAYAPSLKHMPRADQWDFLVDTMGQDDFATLAAHTWSYNRTRLMDPGDTQLFRPVLFLLLSFEKAWFGTDFAAWQAFNLLLHVIVCCLFLGLLRRVFALARPAGTVGWSWIDLLPLGLTFFFALNVGLVEQVIYHHLSGYLLFVVFVLGSLTLLLDVASKPELAGWPLVLRLSAAWLLILLAAFTYELGQVYAVLAGLYLAAVEYRQGRWRPALRTLLVFAAIAVIYQTVNALDRWYRRTEFANDLPAATVLQLLFSAATVNNLGRYVLFAVVQPFLPWSTQITFVPRAGRPAFHEFLWNGEISLNFLVVVSLGLFALWAAVCLFGLRRLVSSKNRPLGAFALLALSLASVHAALIVAGRLNPRPRPGDLEVNAHYVYMTLLFVLLGSAAGLAQFRHTRSVLGASKLSRLFGQTGLVLLAGLIVVGSAGAVKVRQLNRSLAGRYRHFRICNDTLRAFVAKHKHEPGFCFALELNRQDQIQEMDGLPFTIVLYQRYLSARHPRYVVWFEQGRAQSAPVATWAAVHPNARMRLCPDLVRLAAHSCVFRKDGIHWDVPLGSIHAFLYKDIAPQTAGEVPQ